MNVYSLHTINDGKWSIRLTIKETDDFKHRYESRPDLRALVDEYYNRSPEELARILIEQVLDCETVEVNLMCGPGIVMRKA
jgi:hypothetical protein